MTDLVLADIRSPAALAALAIGCTGFINLEAARQAGCGHSIHSDLHMRSGDFGAGNQSQGGILCCTLDSNVERNQLWARWCAIFCEASCNDLLPQEVFSSTTLCITVCWMVVGALGD